MMNSKYTVLVIEDDAAIGNFLSTILSANGYGVLRARDGADGMMLVTSHCPDLILLDLGLPDMDGNSIIRSVRDWSRIPIIVVSGHCHEKDKVAALDLGADDYVTKPFGSAELLARVRTALRHGEAQGDLEMPSVGEFHSGSLLVDYNKRRAYVDGVDAHLTQNEYKILALLARHAGRVLTHEHIIRAVWGPNFSGDNQILRVNMANIRRKLEKNPAAPAYLFTEMGVGYRLAEED